MMAAHPELEPLAVLVLVLVNSVEPKDEGVSTAQLARRLGIEHALIRRAAAELDTREWVTTAPVGGASPALRLFPRSRGEWGSPSP